RGHQRDGEEEGQGRAREVRHDPSVPVRVEGSRGRPVRRGGEGVGGGTRWPSGEDPLTPYPSPRPRARRPRNGGSKPSAHILHAGGPAHSRFPASANGPLKDRPRILPGRGRAKK